MSKIHDCNRNSSPHTNNIIIACLKLDFDDMSKIILRWTSYSVHFYSIFIIFLQLFLSLFP